MIRPRNRLVRLLGYVSEPATTGLLREQNTTAQLTNHGGCSPAAAGRIRVLVVEPRCIYAAAMAKYLGGQQFAVEIAHSETSALKLLRDADPDVVMVGMGPHPRSVELFDRLREQCGPPLVAVTDMEIASSTMAAEPISDQLVIRIRRALRRSVSGTADVRRRRSLDGNPVRTHTITALDVDLAARRVLVDGHPVALTRTEFEVLALLFARPGEVVSRRALQNELWGHSWTGNRYTLDMHVGNLRRKLGDDPQAPRYVQTVRGVGYRLGL